MNTEENTMTTELAGTEALFDNFEERAHVRTTDTLAEILRAAADVLAPLDATEAHIKVAVTVKGQTGSAEMVKRAIWDLYRDAAFLDEVNAAAEE